ncbi:hypothetical protein N0V93_004370 [Gnomoniopsis smithogilvyi]|uniref:Multicopper oxidase n=1 Tax=Gnomoniopsis smithogilvyi TaxID=1191159 RepID=A0A9W8YQZ2_9PEZI|nr:hypothetical protein N0V93_004370 [Gnomoniopsis smithogilvyi]
MNHEADSYDMDEKADEKGGLIPHQQQVSRPAGLRGLLARFYTPSGNSSSARLLDAADSDELEDVEITQHEPRQHRLAAQRFVPSFRTFILAIVFFALGLGIGCGLGLSIPYYDSFVKVLSNLVDNTLPYNDYGIPDTLPIISSTQLVNAAELDLQTDFMISRTSTTREYEFNISHGLAAPDGVYKPMILANGQSPGPLIEANTGDKLRITVNNLMPNTTTSIHWHGINQYNSTWMDGVAGISQCGIPAGGGSWTYEFTLADQRGTYWWHAHTGVQFTDGLFGPIVIHDPDEMVPETDDEKIVFLGENYHSFASELLSHYLSPSTPWDPNEAGVEPLADNLLLNGQNTFPCDLTSTTFPLSISSHKAQSNTPACTGGQPYTTTVKPGSATRLRLINHSSYFSYWFSIDDHALVIVEIDGVEVEPIEAQGVHVNIGQRYSVIVNASQPGGEYAMRSTLERECFLPFATYNNTALASNGYEARGILKYDSTSRENQTNEDDDHPSTTLNISNNPSNYSNPNPQLCFDLPFDTPISKRPEEAYPLATNDPQYMIDFQFRQVGEVNRIFLNRTSWAAYTSDATLWQALDQTFDYAPGADVGGAYHNWDFRLDQQVLLVPEGSGSVQVVVNSLDVMEHPFHMHGHTVQIVGWGPGRYMPGSSATTWNLENPMRRDTFTVPEQSHVVIRFRADNPGMWILHCHVAWHLEAGMAASFLERPDDLMALVSEMDAGTKKQAQNFCAKRST